jgi:hypothetical protein
MALLLSGHTAAPALSPMVSDIADALYWLQEIDSPISLRCTYNVIARNLLHVCTNGYEYKHPYKTHSQLAIFVTFIILL